MEAADLFNFHVNRFPQNTVDSLANARALELFDEAKQSSNLAVFAGWLRVAKSGRR